jgi:hypothetical protein
MAPFLYLGRDLKELRDRRADDIGPSAPESTMATRPRHGSRLRPETATLLASSANLASAARLLLDQHFALVPSEMIGSAVNFDLTVSEAPRVSRASVHRRRISGFA